MPGTSTFNIAFTAKADPPLNRGALENAVTKLAQRHAALRTIFGISEDGVPVQRVMPDVSPEITFHDASNWEETELRDRVLKDFQHSFDLSRSLMRIAVYRRHDSDVILFNVHHMVFDAWSLRICFDDLKKLYASEINGGTAKLPPLTAEYKEFVEWEARTLEGPESDKLWRYWKTKLNGELPELRLPSPLKRPDVIVARGECIPLAFGTTLSNEINRIAREYKMTPYTLLLAAFQALLSRYTGQTDIIVGTSASGRDNRKWTNVIGYFVNLLPLRADLSGNPTFAEHLARTKEAVLGAIKNEAFPFPLMVERLRVRRSLTRAPIFQAFFNFLTDRSNELGPLSMGSVDCAIEFGPSTLRPCIIIPQQEGQSEVVLQLAELQGQIVGNLNYNSDIVDRSTAESMTRSYQRILELIIARQDIPISELVENETSADRDEIVL